MEKRITKRDNLNEILTIVSELNREDLVNFVNHEIELLDRRANSNSLTKVQKENLELVEVIYDTLVELAKAATITEIQDAEVRLSELSNQKMSALLKKLVDSNRIVKVVEKGKSYFSIAD